MMSDTLAGECLADVCLARGDVCADAGPYWLAGSTCIDGGCVCTPNQDQNMTTVGQWARANNAGTLSVCLRSDVGAAVGSQEE